MKYGVQSQSADFGVASRRWSSERTLQLVVYDFDGLVLGRFFPPPSSRRRAGATVPSIVSASPPLWNLSVAHITIRNSSLLQRIRTLMKSLIAIVLGLAPFASAVAADDITIERLFGPEIPGKYKHPPSITELDNGDLYVVYYGGDGEYAGDTAVYGSRLAKGSEQWTRPKIIADTPDRSEGNAAIWQAPDGVVWLFYVTNYGPTWSTSRIKYKLSKDRAQTWTDSDMLAFELGSMVRGRPIVLNNGDYLLPVYHETGEDRERTAADTMQLLPSLQSQDKNVDRVEPNRLAEWQSPARAGADYRRLSGCLLSARRRFRTKPKTLRHPQRVARRRPNVEQGRKLPVSQSELSGRLHQAPKRPFAFGVQRHQHRRPHAAHGGHFDRQ